MTDCWVNVMSRHAVHPLHLHPLAVVSGTYYVATPRGCSRIRFEDPRLDKLMGAPPKRPDCRPENRQQVSYDVAAGQADPVRELAAPRGRLQPDPRRARQHQLQLQLGLTPVTERSFWKSVLA